MRKTTRKPSKNKVFATQTAFASGLNTPISTVSGWIQHEKWPWSKSPPWPKSIVPAVLAWADSNLDRKGGRPSLAIKFPEQVQRTKHYRDLKLKEEIRKLRAQVAQEETTLAERRGQLHDAEECELEAVRRAALFRNAVQNLPTQLVSLVLANGMPHESAPQVQRQIERLVHACLKQAAASADEESEASDGAGAAQSSSSPAVASNRVGRKLPRSVRRGKQ